MLREMADQGERRSSGGDQKSGSVEGTRSLADLNINKKQSHQWQKLAGIPEPEFEVFVDNCVAKAEKIILNKKDDFLHQNSGDFELYTPAEYVEAARDVMGVIDLDPASCKLANTIIQAKRFYDQKTNGLLKPWSGKVWMNPPYANKLVVEFTERLIHFVAEGEVTEARAYAQHDRNGVFPKFRFASVDDVFSERPGHSLDA